MSKDTMPLWMQKFWSDKPTEYTKDDIFHLEPGSEKAVYLKILCLKSSPIPPISSAFLRTNSNGYFFTNTGGKFRLKGSDENMADYTVRNEPQFVDETIDKVQKLEQTAGQSSDKIMSQKAVTEQLDEKVEKIDGMGLSANNFTNAEKEKLERLNQAFEILLTADGWQNVGEKSYTQTVAVEKLKSTDTVIADVSLSSDEVVAAKELQIWENVTRIEIFNGSAKVHYHGEIPDITLKLKLKI